jgi:C4-dicarboxylate-specific signal transduction histidine kinase
LDLVDHDKRRSGRVEIHNIIYSIVEKFKPFLDSRGVIVNLDLIPQKPFLRGSEAAIESVFANFINNSLIWFEGIKREKRTILIRTRIEGNIIIVSFLDNGPGIEGIKKQDIWLPGQTTRPNGTGLGLTIVRDAVKDLGGNVDVKEHGELGGAEFIIELPFIGA